MDEVSEAEKVTGAPSGSYTKSKLKAKHYLVGNDNLLSKAIELANANFGIDTDGPEKADVLIRQYIAPLIVLRMTY